MLGASLNEIGLVALLLSLVLLAGKVSAIGEAIGGLFAGAKGSDQADGDGKKTERHEGS